MRSVRLACRFQNLEEEKKQLMRRFVTIALALVSLNTLLAEPGDSKPVKASLGINLSGPTDWNTEIPFTNVFHFSRPWIPKESDGPWGEGAPLQLDPQGWVKQLEPGNVAMSLVLTIPAPHWPGGRYMVGYNGKGTITFPGGAATVIESSPGQMQLDVNPEQGDFLIALESTDPEDYLRDLRIMLPNSSLTNPWRQGFLDLWQGVACLRFMDFMMTNNSKVETWEQRPKVGDASYMRAGVPLEMMIDLANRLDADAWFCIPHRADDNYVKHFARMVRDRLDRHLRVYIEYSNETWNSIFSQNTYCAEQGADLALAPKDKPWVCAWLYTARRATQIFKIFAEEMNDPNRLVRVLGVQTGQAYMTRKMLDFGDTRHHVDAIASAPYIGFNIPEAAPEGELTAAEVAEWNHDRLFEHLNRVVLPESLARIVRLSEVASEYHLRFIAYEGGQHLVGITGGENNQQLTELFTSANADPRMGDLYTKYLKGWQERSGDLFCHFSSVTRWTKWGSWGLMQYYDQNPLEQPKFRSTLEWAASHGQDVGKATSAGSR